MCRRVTYLVFAREVRILGLMRSGISGAGPAGLYFALLMKRRDPTHAIRILEQNERGSTYGWGVVFSGRAQSFLRDADAESYRKITEVLKVWDELTIVHEGEAVRIDGSGFSGIARLDLLRILEQQCIDCGVEIEFGSRLEDMRALEGYDLVVGADGANSTVRRLQGAHFGARIDPLSNKYAWYGTPHVFDTLTLTFKRNSDGEFVAHSYPYSDRLSTFAVECGAETWHKAGFGIMSADDSRHYCERLFEEDLHGQPLLTNKSMWLNFPVLVTERLAHGNVVLLGDAARTVHFSIGSGTRAALEDAIALANVLDTTKSVPEAFVEYEKVRRPAADRLAEVAERSYRWYEKFASRMHLSPLEFAYDYMTRGGKVDTEALQKRSPVFASRYEEAMRRAASQP